MIRQSRITSDCGWLAPDGGWYPCKLEEHRALAREILAAAGEPADGPDRSIFGGYEAILEKRGWAKLIPGGGFLSTGIVSVGWDATATPRQNRRLLDWCLGEGRSRTELPHWLDPDCAPEEGLP